MGKPCRRYGLLGPNGCGKSCLLKSLAAREVPIPEHIDIYHLDREAAASEETALDCVKSVDDERIRLDKEAEALLEQEMCPEIEQRLEDIYERCVPQRHNAISSAHIIMSGRVPPPQTGLCMDNTRWWRQAPCKAHGSPR